MKEDESKVFVVDTSLLTNQDKNHNKKGGFLKYRLITKTAAFVLSVLMIGVFALCGVSAWLMAVCDVYNTPRSVMKAEILEAIALDDCDTFIYYILEGDYESAGMFCSERNIDYVYLQDAQNGECIWLWGDPPEGAVYYDYTDVSFLWTDGYYRYGNTEDGTLMGAENNINVMMRIIPDRANQDGYYFASLLIDVAYSMKCYVYIVGASALLLAILLIVYLVYASGRRTDGELKDGWGAKVPFDLLTVVSAGFVVACVFVTAVVLDELYLGMVSALPLGAMCIVSLFAVTSVALGWLMSFSSRIKRGSFWKNTLIYYFALATYKTAKFLFRYSKKKLSVLQGVPFAWKTAVMVVVTSLAEFFLILFCWDDPEILLILWFLEKVLLVPLLIKCVMMLKKLKKAGDELSRGETEYKVNTEGLWGDFKRHGEALNGIASGMSLAVEKQLRSERMKTELITNVSHDIKTPLTSVINYADLIVKEPCENERITEYAEVLRRSSTRLSRLIEDLVEASKATTGNLEVCLSRCDLGIFVSQVAGEYKDKLNSQGLELVVSGEDENCTILADGRRLWRVFDNLMNNICKYAQKGTRVYIALEREGNQAVISLKNVSCAPLNVSAEELMERFVRGDASRTTEGNGLGLSIARSLVELQGGSFDIYIDGDLFKAVMKFPIKE